MTKWNKETCLQEAKKYRSRSEFSSNSIRAYYVAKLNGWVDEYTWLKNPNQKWTRDTVREESKKYETMRDFREKVPGVYRIALENGWLSEYIWLATNRKWTYENCYELAKKCKSINEFFKMNSSAYQTARRKDWLKDYTWFKRPETHNKKWTYEVCLTEARKYTRKTDFQKGCPCGYNAAYKNKWLVDYDWFITKTKKKKAKKA